jgi:hypothetical protein
LETLPTLADCQAAFEKIDAFSIYSDQTDFSVGDCFIAYATDEAESDPISGQIIKSLIQDILNVCEFYKGSFGTGNCDTCRVAVSARTQKRFVV